MPAHYLRWQYRLCYYCKMVTTTWKQTSLFAHLKMLTGFPCPGCGITKSLVFFYEGNLYKSLGYHILGPFVIAFAILSVVVLVTELITEKEYFDKWLYNRKLAYGLAIFLASYHLIRLIYFVQDNSLAGILQQSVWR